MFRAIKSGIYCTIFVFMLCILFHIGLILAHLSDYLTNYLWIKHSGAVIAHLSVGDSQLYCNMELGLMMMIY